MAHKIQTSHQARILRHDRLRKKLSGSPERPRLSVYRSLNHIYAQVIDDSLGKTLASASSLEPTLRTGGASKNKTTQAKAVGQLVADRASKVGVNMVVFDRGGFQYHGRVQALADAAREGGLKF